MHECERLARQSEHRPTRWLPPGLRSQRAAAAPLNRRTCAVAQRPPDAQIHGPSHHGHPLWRRRELATYTEARYGKWKNAGKSVKLLLKRHVMSVTSWQRFAARYGKWKNSGKSVKLLLKFAPHERTLVSSGGCNNVSVTTQPLNRFTHVQWMNRGSWSSWCQQRSPNLHTLTCSLGSYTRKLQSTKDIDQTLT